MNQICVLLTIYFLITAVRWRSCRWLRSLRRTRSGSSTRPTSELWRGTPGWEQQQSSPLLWHPGREAAQPPPHPDQVRRLINDFWSTQGFFFKSSWYEQCDMTHFKPFTVNGGGSGMRTTVTTRTHSDGTKIRTETFSYSSKPTRTVTTTKTAA